MMDGCIETLAASGLAPATGWLIAAVIIVAAGLSIVLTRGHRHARSAALALAVIAAVVATGTIVSTPAQAAACVTPAPTSMTAAPTPTSTASATPTPSPEPTGTAAPSDPITVEFIRQCADDPQLIVRVTNTTDEYRSLSIEYTNENGDQAGDGGDVPAHSVRDFPGWLGVNLTYTISVRGDVIAEESFEACPPRSTATLSQLCGAPPSYTATVENPASVAREALIVVTSGGTEIERRTVAVDAESSTSTAFAITGDAEFSVTVDGSEIAQQVFSACTVRDVVATITPSCTADDPQGFHVMLSNDNAEDVDARVEVEYADEPGVWGFTVPVSASSSAEFSQPRSAAETTITVTQDGRPVAQTVVPGCAL